MRSIMRLLRNDSGAVEMEYGLFAALFAVGAVACCSWRECSKGSAAAPGG